MQRGLDDFPRSQVADQLMKHDALGAHARDELGLSEMHTARPIQAALASAATFAVGAALPLLMVLISPFSIVIPVVAGSSLVFLAVMGGRCADRWGAHCGRRGTRGFLGSVGDGGDRGARRIVRKRRLRHGPSWM